MDEPEVATSPADGATGKLLGGAMLKVQLGVGCAAVLILGFWLAPRTPPTALSTPQERAVPLLEEQAHGRAAADLARSVREVARSAADYSVSFAVGEPASRPVRRDFEWSMAPQAIGVAFGVRVSESRVLTHLDALRSPTAVEGRSADGTPFGAKVIAFEPATGLILLETLPATVGPAPMSPVSATAGVLVVGAARSRQGVFAAPMFVEAVEDSRVVVSAILPAGLPLFDLEGRLVAIAGRGRAAAFAAAAAVDRLVARAGADERSFGLSLQDRAGLLEKALGPKGVVVSDVVIGGPAHRAGLRPGDLLLTIGDVDIDTVADAMRALGASRHRGAPVRLFARGPSERRPRGVEMAAVPAVVIAALARTPRSDDAALAAAAVFDAAALHASGAPPSARLLEVNGVIVGSRDEVRRALRRRPMPAILVLRDGDDRFVSAIEVAR